jgi:hypothetical protein
MGRIIQSGDIVARRLDDGVYRLARYTDGADYPLIGEVALKRRQAEARVLPLPEDISPTGGSKNRTGDCGGSKTNHPPTRRKPDLRSTSGNVGYPTLTRAKVRPRTVVAFWVPASCPPASSG